MRDGLPPRVDPEDRPQPRAPEPYYDEDGEDDIDDEGYYDDDDFYDDDDDEDDDW